ncbi:hypothetical protein AAFF_G00210900 [Aldrovandia affinis]|uniref:Uncharacterized protein n=1 Tax=Aldrovandia affinis TaxID=143900 RepID=A0AAD7SWH6_9TELE|nr:hypothetical protein AAFF_G00210900 [Aldrovandia affinis]
MQVDLEQRLIFPPEIITTNLRPDLVLWSTSQKLLVIVELTVPWEAAVGEAYERKRLKYSDIAAEAEQRGWRAQCSRSRSGVEVLLQRPQPSFLRGWECEDRPSDKPSNQCQRLRAKQQLAMDQKKGPQLGC